MGDLRTLRLAPSASSTRFFAATLAAMLAAACGDSTAVAPGADSGITETPADAAGADASERDAGRPDAGRSDGGLPDIGSRDPDTVLEGVQEIGGLSTYVRLMGTETSTLPPVVLLPTGPELAHEYLPDLMRFLLRGRLLMFYDLRATGRTSFGSAATTTSITADRHALDLDDVVTWVGTRASAPRVDLVGHGYGAAIAALYAAAHPERVAHLVLTAPYPATAVQLAGYRAEAGSRLTSSERTMRNRILEGIECSQNINRCTLEVWNIDGPHYLCDENRDLFRTMTFEYGDDRTRDTIELDLTRHRYDWRPRLAVIQAPTTVISGPCDPIPAEVPLTYTSSISGAVHHVLGTSGHFPMLEQREAYQRLVLEALRR